jgi:hypothetical protein
MGKDTMSLRGGAISTGPGSVSDSMDGDAIRSGAASRAPRGKVL